MTHDTGVLRGATDRDVQPAARLLADAFIDYPWTRWTVQADDHRERLEALYALVLADLVLPYGRAWVVEGPDGRLAGVSGWLPPSPGAPAATLQRVGAETARLQGDRSAAAAEAATRVEAATSAVAAEEPHWYLGTIGVAPEQQGRGLGGLLLAPGLEKADADGVAVRLETSSERNVALYRRHGFATLAQVPPVGPDAPPCWVMRRGPRSPTTGE